MLQLPFAHSNKDKTMNKLTIAALVAVVVTVWVGIASAQETAQACSVDAHGNLVNCSTVVLHPAPVVVKHVAK